MNKEEAFSGQNGDKAFIDALLVRIFGDELRSENELNCVQLSFVKGINKIKKIHSFIQRIIKFIGLRPIVFVYRFIQNSHDRKS